MGPVTPASTRPTRLPYFAIDLATLRADRLLNFDLYICIDGEMILYREKALAFDEHCRQRLLESQVYQVYIDDAQRSQFLGYMEAELPLLLKDGNIKPEKKASIVYSTSKVIVEDIFENPNFGENIQRSKGLVVNTVELLTGAPDSFQNLIKLSDPDYKLYSHSVNVCTLSLGLAQEVGIKDSRALEALGIGAMLHDVGKTRIDSRILRKRTPLSREEYELMKKHVELGVVILRDTQNIPEAAYYPVAQHQEREDGSGYPRGLKGSDIHLFGKITGIADVFDAMTSSRTYRRAIPGFETFKTMLEMPVDQGLLRAFIALFGPR